MTTPYIGEIRMFGGDFAPAGWAYCHGQLLAISQYDALFALIGTTYGGNGTTSFALPDMRGRVPIHMGQGPGLSNYVIGEMSGTENVTLMSTQIPSHNHSVMASANAGTDPQPNSGAVPASPVGSTAFLYVVPGSSSVVPVEMSPSSIELAGGSLPHDNMMPSLALNFIIALFGVFPSRN
ncbi:phage tail protein [Novosphingobium naphthalenivorans]|uniref:phage tail protein n=1 Tax=Novosphingobium naphthalenivorans TaxID=273168 RepID=UPI00082D0789|nr:tail fiber protein [Novosphingobium naphthalenivorans]